MNLRPLIIAHADRMACQLVDSTVAETREFWRMKHGATPEQAKDPRPFAEVRA